MAALEYRPHLSSFSIRASPLLPQPFLSTGAYTSIRPCFLILFTPKKCAPFQLHSGGLPGFGSNVNVSQLLGLWCICLEGCKKGCQWLGWWKGQGWPSEESGDKRNHGVEGYKVVTGLRFFTAMLHLLTVTGCLKECLEVPGCNLMFSPKMTTSGETKSPCGILGLVSLCTGSKRQLAQFAAPLVSQSGWLQSCCSSCAAFPILRRPLLTHMWEEDGIYWAAVSRLWWHFLLTIPIMEKRNISPCQAPGQQNVKFFWVALFIIFNSFWLWTLASSPVLSYWLPSISAEESDQK